MRWWHGIKSPDKCYRDTSNKASRRLSIYFHLTITKCEGAFQYYLTQVRGTHLKFFDEATNLNNGLAAVFLDMEMLTVWYSSSSCEAPLRSCERLPKSYTYLQSTRSPYPHRLLCFDATEKPYPLRHVCDYCYCVASLRALAMRGCRRIMFGRCPPLPTCTM